MQTITIKNAAGQDCAFKVIRQASGTQSAILQYALTGEGLNRTAFPKIEVSTRIQAGATSPVISATVPYGSVVNGVFVKKGQVSSTNSVKQPAESPDSARADLAAFVKNLSADPQIVALLESGLL